jgi:hypothetical protein
MRAASWRIGASGASLSARACSVVQAVVTVTRPRVRLTDRAIPRLPGSCCSSGWSVPFTNDTTSSMRSAFPSTVVTRAYTCLTP